MINVNCANCDKPLPIKRERGDFLHEAGLECEDCIEDIEDVKEVIRRRQGGIRK